LAPSLWAGWDCPTANAHVSDTAPRLAVIDKLSRPRVIPFPPASFNRRPAKRCGELRSIAPNRAGCAYPFFV
jgi:hypothetical protein